MRKVVQDFDSESLALWVDIPKSRRRPKVQAIMDQKIVEIFHVQLLFPGLT